MQEYSDAHHDELVACRVTLDKVSKANMERCAEFMARMIIKYGKKVLEEIEAEEAAAKENASKTE